MADNKTEKLEREYVIPLRKEWMKVPRYRKTNKAVKAVKEFLVRHMKIRDKDLNKVKVDKFLNELLWMRGVKNPPSKVKVKAIKEGDVVKAELVEMPANIKFRKLREEKLESSAKEVAKKRKAEKVESEETDKDKDGVDDKKEEKEDKAAVVEAGKEMQKEEAKKAKHETKVKSPKEQKNQKTGYNKSSQGH